MKLLALIASIVPLGACGSEPVVGEAPEKTAPAPKPVAEVPVVQRGYLGVLTPRESQDVLSPLTSTIAELKVQLGDQVKKDQIVARFDDRSVKQNLEAEASKLRARLAEIAQRKIQLNSAQLELEREKKAYDEKIVPKSNVDQAELKVRDAQAALQGANAQYEEQRANVTKLEERIKDATVRAPADGRVSLLYHREGERVEEGQPVLQVISGDLYIKFAIPGDKVGTLVAGDEVDVVVDQQAIKTKAIVRRVQPKLDEVSQMIIAEADLAGPADKLQGGQRCHILPRPKKP